MTARRLAVTAALTVVTLLLAWALFFALPRRYAPPATRTVAAAPSPAAPAQPGRKIKARLFYVAEDGLRLTPTDREVSYGEGTVEQARQILEAQLAPVSEPLVSAVPPGTKLRAVFVTDRGDAFVDLSREASSAHPGGTLNEILTVYTIVDALTDNLPAVSAVQVLVDGKEVDTLAGHVDLRRPLSKDLSWVVAER